MFIDRRKFLGVLASSACVGAANAATPSVRTIILGRRRTGPCVSSYRTHAEDVNDLTDYTFTAQDIGTPSSTRYVVVGILGRGASSRTISAVTIGGVPASPLGSLSTLETGTMLGFRIALVAAGATADIVVNWSNSLSRCGIVVWSIEGLQSTTATAQASQTTATANAWPVNLDIAAGGSAFALAYNANVTSGFTWAGLTERYDVAIESPQATISAASDDFAAAVAARAISATVTTSSVTGGILAVAVR